MIRTRGSHIFRTPPCVIGGVPDCLMGLNLTFFWMSFVFVFFGTSKMSLKLVLGRCSYIGSIGFHRHVCWGESLWHAPSIVRTTNPSPFVYCHNRSQEYTQIVYHIWLVVWNINFIFPYFPINIGFLIIPIDELIFFRGVQTTNQILFQHVSTLWSTMRIRCYWKIATRVGGRVFFLNPLKPLSSKKEGLGFTSWIMNSEIECRLAS